jgi:hypothetical protein
VYAAGVSQTVFVTIRGLSHWQQLTTYDQLQQLLAIVLCKLRVSTLTSALHARAYLRSMTRMPLLQQLILVAQCLLRNSLCACSFNATNE